MKNSGQSMSLTSYDDLFSTEQSREDANREKVLEISLSELYPFKNHPFKVKDDDRMLDTAESIREYGVLVPALARPRADGGYELIAGHRRKRGCELAGLETMPVIMRDLDDDEAVIVMVDSNIQRESLLPSERAFAYKMKLDAMKRQSGRPNRAAVELSYLKPDEQRMLLTAMDSEQATPSLSQAQRLKRFSQDGRLSEDSMLAIMSEEKNGR